MNKEVTSWDIMEKLNELHTDHSLVAQKMDDVVESVTHLEHTVYGNGREGLVEALGRIEERVKTLFTYTNLMSGLGMTVAGSIIAFLLLG